jgi:hypothetical protein
MGRPRNSDTQLENQAREAVKNAKTLEELRTAQAVLLPAETGSTLEQTAALLGVSRAIVNLLQARFRKSRQIEPQLPRFRGGRRNALLSTEQEIEFLTPWLASAQAGGTAFYHHGSRPMQQPVADRRRDASVVVKDARPVPIRPCWS